MSSLRSRLLLGLLTGFALLWLAGSAATYWSVRHEVGRLFDEELLEAAGLIAGFVAAEYEEHQMRQGPKGRIEDDHGRSARLTFQIWHLDELVVRSSGAPAEPMGDVPGFADRTIDGREWRIYGTLAKHERLFRIYVGEELRTRHQIVDEVLLHTLWPLAISVPLLAFFIWFAVQRGLRPLRILAGQVEERGPEQLDPIRDPLVPEEIQPLSTALNALLRQLDRALDLERRFTGDAAHELRNPLAGIRANAQVARRARSAAERDFALDLVAEGIDRASHLVTQLLQLARLDGETYLQQIEQIPVKNLVSAVLGTYAAAAEARMIELSVEIPENCEILGHHAALEVLVGNLISNAIRHSEEYGLIRIVTICDPTGVRLTVRDSGPGIPPGLRDRVFDRFFRTGNEHSPGAGLGLAIVRRIADLHGARISLGDNPEGSGLHVEVHFPRNMGGRILDSDIRREPLDTKRTLPGLDDRETLTR